MNSLVVALALTAAPATVAEEAVEPPPAVRPIRHALEVEPGASCLDGDRIASKVISFLREPEVDTRIEVKIRGDSANPDLVRFEVRKLGAVAAEREFSFPPATSCDEKHAVVGVAVALAIDATRVQSTDQGPPVEPILEPQTPQARRTGRRRKPAASEDPAKPSPWEARLGVGAGAAFGAPPDIGGYGAVYAEFGWKQYLDLSLGALVGGAPPIDAAGGRAAPWVVGGQASVCGGYAWDAIRARGCAGAILGAALASGDGYGDDRTARVPWLAVVAGPDLRFRVARRVELELGGDLVVHAIRPAFDVLDAYGQRTIGREFPLVGFLAGVGVIFTLR